MHSQCFRNFISFPKQTNKQKTCRCHVLNQLRAKPVKIQGSSRDISMGEASGFRRWSEKKKKNMCVLRRRSAQMIDPPLGSMLANGIGHNFKNSWYNIMCSGESFREVWQSVSHSHTTKSKTCTYMPGDLTGRQALLEKRQGRLHHFNWYLEGFFGVADKTISVVCITHLTSYLGKN